MDLYNVVQCYIKSQITISLAIQIQKNFNIMGIILLTNLTIILLTNLFNYYIINKPSIILLTNHTDALIKD